MIDAEFKKLLEGGIWAEDATDNVDPDSPSITPVLTRSNGFPTSYSQVGGDVPDRRRINQILRELYGAAFEVRMGVSLYDRDVNYPINAITSTGGVLYRALRANGPAHQNTAGPNETNGHLNWAAVSGAVSVPDAPHSFDFDNSQASRLLVRWRDGRDNGSRIIGYDFQYRINETGAWTPDPPAQPEFAEYSIAGVATNTRVFVRAWARNASGTGPPLTDAIGEVIVGTVPGGGDSIGLKATAGDGDATLTWTAPNNGGSPITQYVAQYRSASETFSSGNQSSVSGATTLTIGSLTNGTQYFFRVAAINDIGQGDWSNIANATPMTATPTLFHPTLRQPSLTALTNGNISASTQLVNSTEGTTADVTQTDWSIKETTASSSAWNTTSRTNAPGLTSYTFTGLTSGTSYDVRYRVYTSVEPTNPPWSPTNTISTAAGRVPSAPTSVSGSAWWRRTNQFGSHRNQGWSWSVNGVNGNGSPILQYQVRATFNRSTNNNPNENIGGRFTASDGSTSSSETFRGLPAVPQRGSTYTIFGRARNENGWGPWTESNTLTVGGDVP